MNKTLHTIYIASFFLIGVMAALIIAADGFSYYTTSIEERFFHQQHELLKPSGVLGHGYGIIGSLMMTAGVALYMLRKRVKSLFRFGYLKHWLEFHIFLCTVGPMLVLYHTAFKFGGIVAVSFWSMAAVVISGFGGRFIYLQIPRTIQGKEIDIRELKEQGEYFNGELKNKYSLDNSMINGISDFNSSRKFSEMTFISSLLFVLKDYFRIKKFTGDLGSELRNAGIPKQKRKEIIKSVKQQLILGRRIGLLRTMQKLFKFWHVVHLPFAIVMFIIMIVHIVITILFGYRWIF